MFSRYPKVFSIKPDTVDLPVIDLLEQAPLFTPLHALLRRLFVTDDTVVPGHHERICLQW